MEAQENMFIWVTADSPSQMVKDMLLDLLNTIYDEHRAWCQQFSQSCPPSLSPQIIDNPVHPLQFQ